MKLVAYIVSTLLTGLCLGGVASMWLVREQAVYDVLYREEILDPPEEWGNGDEWWLPTWIARTTICVQREGQWECRHAPEAEYRSQEECDATEWETIHRLAQEMGPLAANVNCVQEYEA